VFLHSFHMILPVYLVNCNFPLQLWKIP
jgi:hypothetical protein